MAPTRPGVPPDWKPDHEARANTVPGTTDRFYGVCAHGDFASQELRDSEAAAKADVAEHVAAFR